MFMLEFFYDSPTRLKRLRTGLLATHIEEFAAHLRQRGYTRNSGRALLTHVAAFSYFATVQGVTEPARIDDALIYRFVTDVLAVGGRENAMAHLLAFLRERGVIPALAASSKHDPFAAVLHRYDVHLQDVRGLAIVTRATYLRSARGFLTFHQSRHGQMALKEIAGAEVLEYITGSLARHQSPAWRRHLCSESRGFLRFLHAEGLIASDLARVVPRTTRRRLDQVPRHLPWDEVERLIAGVDLTHPNGRRDRAVMLLIATLGLRNKEVRCLTLKDVHWRDGAIHLPWTKAARARVMPLPKALGEALADYVLHERPALAVPQLFLRHKAPAGPFTTSGAVANIVRRHLRRAGIESAHRGAHLLRHSLATRMVNVGVPIKEIADVLGHVSINTTAIYTKVDTTHLAAVALPFPEGV
jgi:site-specific recombinase XerD